MKELLSILGENPDEVKDFIKEQVNIYKPLVYMVGNELLEIYKDYANNTELFKTTAKVKKNQFDAYVSVGFNEEQAMTLLLNDATRIKESINKMSSSISKNKKEK